MQSFPKIKLGILGGGQLSRMLALRAHELGVQPWILSDEPTDPAAQVSRFWVQGSTSQAADLEAFLKQVDVATFESEFLDAGVLHHLSQTLGVRISPAPVLMGVLQDRLTQKKLLLKSKLPTAEFFPVENLQDAQKALKEFDGRMVLKQRRMGYDGYGTFHIRSSAELAKIAQQIEENNFGFIAEPHVAFRRELAVMAARNLSGEKVIFPLVETKQVDSRCLWVKGPLSHRAFAKLRSQIFRFLEENNYVGIMGFELFETSRGLLINELAPRVHNSGHYSMEALLEDQFTVHVKAVLGVEFSKVHLSGRGFAMMNLLGEPHDPVEWDLPADAHLHWYAKQKTRAGRKMGHYTIVGASSASALTKALKIRRKFKI